MGSIADVTQPIPALDFSSFDTDVRVQDDLYRHVNGTWIEQTTIPDDKPLTGAFMVLRDAAEEAVRDIITGMNRQQARPTAATRPRSPISTPASWTARRSSRPARSR